MNGKSGPGHATSMGGKEVNTNISQAPVANSAMIEVVDVHVGGDLHRIVLGGIKPLRSATVGCGVMPAMCTWRLSR